MKFLTLSAAALSVLATVGVAHASNFNEDDGVQFPAEASAPITVTRLNTEFQGGSDNRIPEVRPLLTSDR